MGAATVNVSANTVFLNKILFMQCAAFLALPPKLLLMIPPKIRTQEMRDEFFTLNQAIRPRQNGGAEIGPFGAYPTAERGKRRCHPLLPALSPAHSKTFAHPLGFAYNFCG
jgi:hypothetical protein